MCKLSSDFEQNTKITRKYEGISRKMFLLCSIFFTQKSKKMKNAIVKYGLISGGVAAVLLFGVTLIFKYIGFDKVGFDNSAYFGYGAIIISMSVVYFGIKSYRNLRGEGSFSFGKGLLLGLGIVLTSCIIYSLAWLVIYYNFIPTFIDDYASYCVQKATNAGANAVELKSKITEINQMKEWYKSPFLIFVLTLIEPMPVGILVALGSAFALRRK